MIILSFKNFRERYFNCYKSLIGWHELEFFRSSSIVNLVLRPAFVLLLL